MILKTDFSKGIKEVCLLIGCINPPAEQIQLFYEKLKQAETVDFLAACADEQMIADLAYRGKLVYPIIRQCIEAHQIKRQHIEHEKIKKLAGKKDFERMPEGEFKKMIRGIIKTL